MQEGSQGLARPTMQVARRPVKQAGASDVSGRSMQPAKSRGQRPVPSPAFRQSAARLDPPKADLSDGSMARLRRLNPPHSSWQDMSECRFQAIIAKVPCG
jgi:hypothetical protein